MDGKNFFQQKIVQIQLSWNCFIHLSTIIISTLLAQQTFFYEMGSQI